MITDLRPTVAPPHTVARCPFHDGVATLDLLLAELDPQDSALFDTALDLRALVMAGTDAPACLEQLFRVRALLGEHHYLAFYRVRCWARRALRIEVRAHRLSVWIARELPLDGARLDEIVNGSLAVLAIDGVIPAAAHARFVFAE
jgi:hypothetical protein